MSSVTYGLLFSLSDRLSQLAEIDKKGEEKKEVLAGELERTEKLLASTYDRYECTNRAPKL